MALIKSGNEIGTMRTSGNILSRVVQTLLPEIAIGVSLHDLDHHAYAHIAHLGAAPAFLGYQPYGAAHKFPSTLCTSVNEVVVHGLPTHRRLVEGDILTIDIGAKYRGYYSDMAVTVGIGAISEQAQRLIDVTREALNRAILVATPNHTLGDVGHAVSQYVTGNGFVIVKGLTGHGIGTELHEEPSVLNEGTPGRGMRLQPGMVLAIEVMTSAGSPHIIKNKFDEYETSDSALSAHFEHTVAITEGEPEVLTK
ncbi:MAG: type I methionyl aminopeptidase [Candidatus Harrisonbacteria bacterium CG10_big_fil_rev_8_21_14_0_10_42_17]|uniref:Methionine aminopeptidase n=1 Tax=Candidatus Harrisonbacteria bacterium CG10_big_fil_rev_8_21_14_0_10_42_17 TaxID=1974584 RepID=A0A2M6WHM7_9BACT|nr:MAG: type I methionyl aminopeptidase [Candidatus Harrisonbacteria bacterium CG10_big_fil_rev_8_21_14_0_10_42_17]